MFKYVLSVSLAVSLASAATISTIATCDGVTTTGTTGASCTTDVRVRSLVSALISVDSALVPRRTQGGSTHPRPNPLLPPQPSLTSMSLQCSGEPEEVFSRPALISAVQDKVNSSRLTASPVARHSTAVLTLQLLPLACLKSFRSIW